MWCVVHFMLTPKTLEVQGMRRPKPNTTKELLSSCFNERICPQSILLSAGMSS